MSPSKTFVFLLVALGIIVMDAAAAGDPAIVPNDPRTWKQEQFTEWIAQHSAEAQAICPQITNRYQLPLFHYLKSYPGSGFSRHYREHPPFPLDEIHRSDFPFNHDKSHPRILFHGRPIYKNPFDKKNIDDIMCLTDEGSTAAADSFNLWTAPLSDSGTIGYVFDYALDERQYSVGFIVVFELQNNLDIEMEVFGARELFQIHKRVQNYDKVMAREHDWGCSHGCKQYNAYVFTPEAYLRYQPEILRVYVWEKDDTPLQYGSTSTVSAIINTKKVFTK